jgi:Tol biopolymer transport system component
VTVRLAIAVVTAAALLLLPAAASGLPGNGVIAFGSNGRVYAVDPATGAETDLGSGVSPSWSPDGTKLAFLDFGVTVMNADGSGRRRLHGGGLDRRPVWSPDGTRLAFGSGSSGANGSLMVVDVASGDARVVVPTGVQLDWLPSWSPDGTKLAFTEGTEVDLAIVRADGSDHELLIGGSGIQAAPAWSPDGTQIAFLHSLAGNPSLHLIPTGGNAEPRRLTDTRSWPSSFYGPPAWSPDGSQIAFAGIQILGYGRGGFIVSSAVHVLDAQGTLERRLTRAGDVPGYHTPSWSPDGRRILFEGSGGSYMNTDGTCETRVSDRPATSLTWQPTSAPPAPLLRCADLELTVSHGRSAVEAGGRDVFSLSVKNLENETATGVRLQAGAPVGGSFLGASTTRGSCSLDGGALSCSAADLPVGEVMLVTTTTRATSLGLVASTARASARQLDGNQANNVGLLSFEALPCTMVALDAGGRLLGTKRADTLCGRAGQDLILGLAGNDEIDAGMGPDRVIPGPGRDVVHLRAGADFADIRDGSRDRIDCGGETDLVLADRIDRIARDCDMVASPQIHRCKTLGTMRSDELVGGNDLSDWVCALSGNDEIHTLGGNDAVDAGSGNDTVDGGKGRDLLLGGEGYDTIFARDGARDQIRCGPQYDLVFADRIDVVAGNCERVRRG